MTFIPSPRIVATILAKNEADIIGTTIQHHLEAGVSRIILTDNNSTDTTRSIAERFPEVEIIDEPGDDHHQSKWVTRMARLACKFNPTWIVHLDADELWGGFTELCEFDCDVVVSQRMYMHPPSQDMRGYLDFSGLIEDESKVIHRPDPEIVIAHGNHEVMGKKGVFTDRIYRHHYPIRSYEQFARKAVNGHLALMKRGSICKRWEAWYEAHERGELRAIWTDMVTAWEEMQASPNHRALTTLLKHWSTPDVVERFSTGKLPAVRKLPDPSSLRTS